MEAGVAEVLGVGQILDDADGHADADGDEGEAPVDELANVADDERGDPGADVDAHVVDGEAGVAAGVAGGIEAADERGDVRLEEAGAEADDAEAEIEHFDRGRGEAEVADGDGDAAVEDGLALAEETVSEPSAGDAHEVNEGDDHAIDGGAFAFVEGETSGGDHVEQEQGSHTVVAKALPHFCKKKGREATGVAEETRI